MSATKLKRKLFAYALLVLSVVLLLLGAFPHTVNASVTTTVTCLGMTYDGYISSLEGTYAAAWGAVSGTVYDTDTESYIGQIYVGGPYSVLRTFLFFNTYSIPVGATIDSAVLRLYPAQKTGDNYNITIQTGGTIYPHTPLEATDFYQARYSGNGGSRNVSTVSGYTDYWNITLSTTGLTYITPSGTTKFALRTSNDIAGISDSGNVFLKINTANAGIAYSPQLVVTYTVSSPTPTVTSSPTPTASPSSSPTTPPAVTPTPTPSPIPGMPTPSPTPKPIGPANYIIHGPYYEDGSVANATVMATIYQPYAASQTNTFNGTDGVGDTWNVNFSQPASYLKWNITSAYNYTRLYYFTSESFDEIWLYVPSSTDITQQYSINTILLGKLTNPFVSVLENVNGTNRIIEQQKADPINSLPFWLCMYNQYTLKISSDEGTWTFNLPADTVQTKTFTITADMVTQSNNLVTLTITATRTNGTCITFLYNDPDEQTVLVRTIIQHKYMQSWVTDWDQTDYSNTQFFLMSNATATTDYVANVTAIRNYDIQTRQLPIPAPDSGLVFTGAFDSLGTWPIPSYQLPAIFLCVLFFGVGSWRDSEALAIIAIIICGFLQVIGWASFPAPGITMAAMIVIFAYLHRQKAENVAIESN